MISEGIVRYWFGPTGRRSYRERRLAVGVEIGGEAGVDVVGWREVALE